MSGLFRQDGHGPGPVRRHPADRGGGARRSVQATSRSSSATPPPASIRAAPPARPACRKAASRCAWPPPKRAACWSRWRPSKLGVPADQLTVKDGVVQRATTMRQKSQLRRTDRRPVFQRASRLERQIRQPALRAGQSQAEGPEGSHHRRATDPARRHRAESVCADGFRHRRQSPGHGAWPHDPAGHRRRRAGEGRRKLDQGYPGRQGRLGQGLPRRRRRQGMGRHQGGAAAQGRVVGRRAAVPRSGRALTITSARRRRASAKWTASNRQCRCGVQDRRARDRGRIRMAVPVACLHGAGLRAGRHQGRPRHLLERHAEVAFRADGRRRHPADAAGQCARDLDHGPGLLWPQRCRRLRHGRRGARQGRRQAGAAAIHARPGHRLGSQGAGVDPQGARRARCRRAMSSPTIS